MSTPSDQPTRFATLGRRQILGAAAALVIAPAAVAVAYANPAKQDATPGATPGTPGATPGSTPIAGGGLPTTFEVQMLQTFRFEPANLTVPADTDVTVNATTVGALQHNWAIKEPHFATEIVGDGQSSSVTFNLPAGTYEVLCEVPGHAQAGMIGQLTVQ